MIRDNAFICPRCHHAAEYPGASRATDGRDIEICGPCCNDEAVREARGLPVQKMADWPVPSDWNRDAE